jgi:glutamate carboxypeptidase
MLEWIASQRQVMIDRIASWASVPTGSDSPDGTRRLHVEIRPILERLGAEVESIDLPPATGLDDLGKPTTLPLAPLLVARRRPEAPVQALLVIHLDTVFPRNGGFDRVWREGDRLRGPGVIDAKGGAAVMLTVVEALERVGNPAPGWTVALNPDEEIGSPGSTPHLESMARSATVGLVFEPPMPDGSLVRERKGVGGFTFVARGRSVHAGRDFEHGRNAVVAMCEAMTRVAALTDLPRGITVNVGRLVGGGASNIVPDLAVARVNARIARAEDGPPLAAAIRRVAGDVARLTGCAVECHGDITRMPKPFDDATAGLVARAQRLGRELGMELDAVPTGGVCDGNTLAAAGLPTLDTLGPVGGGLHTHDEYLELDSLVPRAQLAAAMLLDLAKHPPAREGLLPRPRMPDGGGDDGCDQPVVAERRTTWPVSV